MTFMIVDRHGRGTLPEEVRRDLGLDSVKGGSVILAKTGRGTYELAPATLVPKDQLWFHHPEMARRVEEAEADFREGRSTRAENPEAVQAFLDSLKAMTGA